MKKIILTVILLISVNAFSQTEKFYFKPDGTSEYQVFETPNFKASELYQKTINWININYKNPNSVIKAKVENEMIRIDGFGQNVFSRTFKSGSKGNYDVKYTIEFEFQDSKYRVKYIHNGITVDGKQVFFSFTDVINNIPDKNGNVWTNAKEDYEKYIQTQLDSLFNYITRPKDKF